MYTPAKKVVKMYKPAKNDVKIYKRAKKDVKMYKPATKDVCICMAIADEEDKKGWIKQKEYIKR